MPETVGAWTDVAPFDITTTLDAEQHSAEGPLYQQPMWDFSGGTTPEAAPPIASDPALDDIMAVPTEPSSSTALWSLNYDNNYNLRSHWLPVAQNFKTSGGFLCTSLTVVDHDARRWRETFANDRMWEWRAAHPAEVEAGATVEVEWEGGAETSPTRQFGQHSQRRILVASAKTASSQVYAYAIEGDQLVLNGPTPVDAATQFHAPAVESPAGGAYVMNQAETTVRADLSLGERVPDDVLSSALVATIDGNVGATGGVGEVDIPDDLFEAMSRPVMRDLGYAQEHTRAILLWALPDVRRIWSPTLAYEYTAQVVGGVPLLRQVSHFQPPRWRLRINSPLSGAASIRRTYPRHDSLAGGAARNYPPSRALQSSNRIGGGYL